MKVAFFGSIISLAAAALLCAAVEAREIPPQAAPEFTHSGAEAWINSPPLSLKALRGNVVLIDFWTFDCWNCYRSFAWLKSVEDRYEPDGLKVIGVHTPEFKRERIRANVEGKVAEFKLRLRS
jgi:thiol-disulfide isomerase/thioredoxin